jgi:hypothetical protein
MNEKDELIKTIEDTATCSSIKDLAKTCVESAYNAGFREGMKRGSEIMATTFEMLYKPQGVK